MIWRKRVGVEPTGDRKTCRPPILKIIQCVLTGHENSLPYLILQRLTRTEFFDPIRLIMIIELLRFYHSSFNVQVQPTA